MRLSFLTLRQGAATLLAAGFATASALAATATNGILTIDYDDIGRFSL